MRSSCSCAAPPSARSAPCTRRPHYHRASWPFRLLDGERKNVQPFFHRHDRRLHSGQTSSRRSEEHTSELQSQSNLVCRLLLEKKKTILPIVYTTTTIAATQPATRIPVQWCVMPVC